MAPVRHTEAERLRLVYELGQTFASRIELDELIPVVIEKCREAFEAEGASLLLLDPKERELFFYSAAEEPEVVARLERVRVPADRGIAGAVLLSGEAVRVDDVANDPRFYRGVDRKSGVTTRTVICAPLRTGDNTIGVVQVINRVGGPFTDGDLALLSTLAENIAVAMLNARAYDEVKESAAALRAQVVALRRDLARHDRFPDLIGNAESMAEVFRLMESAAASPISVIVEGETGTGKELVARGIHRTSSRADGPFVAVNCAAIPETMLERELFGHRKGAFTGATHDQHGFFETADGGTIFLDEIGEMPSAMQAKLLRVLQEGEVLPLGASTPRPVDVRVISATNQQLDAAVADGSFRQDLYYRLAAFPIALPPLRERRGDVSLLVQHFLTGAKARHAKQIPALAPDTLAILEQHDWPGNVRELQNEIERAVAVARDGETLAPKHLSPRLRTINEDPASDTTAASDEPLRPLRDARSDFEARYIRDALAREHGNVTRAAQALGLSRAMLQRKMKSLGLR